MKFFSQIFGEMNGSDILGVISSLIFFIVFVAVLIRAFSMKKSEAAEYERMPLDDNNINSNNE